MELQHSPFGKDRRCASTSYLVEPKDVECAEAIASDKHVRVERDCRPCDHVVLALT
jgi:hypothetical protein